MKVKTTAILIIVFFISLCTNAQLLYTNGDNIRVTGGTILTVKGAVLNDVGKISVDSFNGYSQMLIESDFINNDVAGGSGNYRVMGNWINNNTFNAGTGTVFLEGSDQFIDGSVSTHFYNITLDGTGAKTQTIDQYCTGKLSLNDVELHTEYFGFYVENPNTDAISFGSGFVSSLVGGFLLRHTNTPGTYIFPVGSSVGTTLYRPVEISPEDNSENTFTVRMANTDATSEGFNLDSTGDDICQVNPLFYHQIDRTEGTSTIALSIYYDNTSDGTQDGIVNWKTSTGQWEIISGSITNAGNPLYQANAIGWNDFSNVPYALYSSNPDITIDTAGPFCYDDFTVQLEASHTGGVWNGDFVDNTGIFDVGAAGAGIHHVSYAISGNCGNTAYKDIIVYPTDFNVDYEATNPYCIGENSGGIKFQVAGGTPPYSYHWDSNVSDSSTISNLSPGTYHFTITDVHGCSKEISNIIIHDGNKDCLGIPDTFTPNSDGVNDTWIIEYIVNYPEIEIKIFNRWGQLLYTGGSHDDFWNGTYKNEQVPTGPYIYIIDKNIEGLNSIVGIVTVIR